MSYPPPNQGHQGNMYPTPSNTPYPPAPAPGYPTPNAPGYGQPPPSYGPGYNQPGPGYQPAPGYYPPPAGPVTNQPMSGQGGWMNMPQGIPNCPPGLEYLTMIDQLLVHQKIDYVEALAGFESNNKYTVKNSLGQKVYYAVEDTDCFTRNCLGHLRPFGMKVLDNYRNEIIHLERPFACDSCCFPCCLQSIEVTSPPGTIVGTVEQEWSLFCPSFAVKNPSGDTVLRIEGPLCTFSICGDIEFKVMSSDGSVQVGKISKQWSGLMREAFTNDDYFGITFPMDLDVRMKAVMLGACFLIDAMFFEKKAGS